MPFYFTPMTATLKATDELLEAREVFVTDLLDAVLTHLDDDVRSYFEDGDLEESVIEDLQSYYDSEEFDKDFRQSMVEHLTY